VKYIHIPNDKYTEAMARRDARVIKKALRKVNKIKKIKGSGTTIGELQSKINEIIEVVNRK